MNGARDLRHVAAAPPHRSRRAQRGAALLTAMIIVALVATLAGVDGLAAVARDPGRRRRARAHAVGVDPLRRARLGPPDPARGRRSTARRQRRPSRRAVGRAARRGAPVDLPRRRQGQHRRCARRLPVRADHRCAGALQPDQPGQADGTPDPDQLEVLQRLCETIGVSADVARPAIATRRLRRRQGRRRAAPPSDGAADAAHASAQLGWLGVDPEALRALEPYVVAARRAADAVNVNTRRARCSSPRSKASTWRRRAVRPVAPARAARSASPTCRLALPPDCRDRRGRSWPSARTSSRCAAGCASAHASSSSARW